jgi:hypothetical protein
MSKHSSNREFYAPPPVRLVKIGSVHDPTPKAIGGGGNIGGQDYTKFIRWTPGKITIATLLFLLPYAAIVFAVIKATSLMGAIPLIILPLILGSFIGAMYWLAKANL